MEFHANFLGDMSATQHCYDTLIYLMLELRTLDSSKKSSQCHNTVPENVKWNTTKISAQTPRVNYWKYNFKTSVLKNKYGIEKNIITVLKILTITKKKIPLNTSVLFRAA